MKIPYIARTLSLCSAVCLGLYTIVRLLFTFVPQIPCSVLVPDGTVTPLPQITVVLLCIVYALALALLILSIYQATVRQISRSGALINVILFAVFVIMQLLGDLMISYIMTLTAVSGGVDAVTTLTAIQKMIGFFSPLATIAYILQGCAVAITGYEAYELYDEEDYDDADEEDDADEA